VACLCLEVEARLAREGGHKCSNHRGQQCEKGRVGEVLSALPSLAERRLVREGTQRVDVHEEVVDEGVHGRQRADGLGRQLLRLGRLQLGEGVGGIGGRLRRRLARMRVGVVQAPLFDVFGVPVGRSAAATGTVKGAGDLEGNAGSTWRARLVALCRVSTARRGLPQ